jgi:hypothetical protein
MDELIGLGSKLIRGAPKVRVTSPVLARYLDDLRFAEQARDLDRFYGRIPPAPGPFDNINLPEPPDPLAAERAVGAAPRTWLEKAEMARGMEPQPAPPLTDMLLDNDRRRTLLANRLDRLTPEQRARSLPSVGRQYEADQAAARAAGIKQGKDVNTAIALGAAGAFGAGAFGARMAQESDRNQQDGKMLADLAMREQLSSDVRDIDITGDDDVYVPDGYVGASADDIPDLFAEDRMLPVTYDVDEISLLDDINAIRVPLPKVRLPQFASGWGPIMSELDRFTEDKMLPLEPDSPDDAVAAAPGPSIPVGRNLNMEDLPGPQMRSVRTLINAGIPAGRAMDIITKGYSMSPDEYRTVTGGRR